MANFLDVFKTIVRLLYIKHAEGVLPRNRVVGYLIEHIPMAVQGVETEDDVAKRKDFLRKIGYKA